MQPSQSTKIRSTPIYVHAAQADVSRNPVEKKIKSNCTKMYMTPVTVGQSIVGKKKGSPASASNIPRLDTNRQWLLLDKWRRKCDLREERIKASKRIPRPQAIHRSQRKGRRWRRVVNGCIPRVHHVQSNGAAIRGELDGCSRQTDQPNRLLAARYCRTATVQYSSGKVVGIECSRQGEGRRKSSGCLRVVSNFCDKSCQVVLIPVYNHWRIVVCSKDESLELFQLGGIQTQICNGLLVRLPVFTVFTLGNSIVNSLWCFRRRHNRALCPWTKQSVVNI
mmetsp:Transcript_17820/g.30722  ORF Transcript_17820/g.30722 Transcript_17820/m.30722 type:complete len:279 (+) Transcript_17820:137-973(+)